MKAPAAWALILLLAFALSPAAPPAEGAAPAAAPRTQPYAVTGVVVIVGGGVLTVRLDEGRTASFRIYEVPGPGAAVPPGTRVRLWVLAMPEGLPVVLRLLTLGGPATARLSTDVEAGTIRGVVLAHRDGILTVLADRNVLYTVLLTGTTVVASRGALPRFTVVQVAGTRNSDGSVSARSVGVLFDPRQAVRVGGRITLVWPEVGFVLADGTVIVTGDDVWIVRGSALRPAGALARGTAVTVLGSRAGPYVRARIVDISP